jgi:hypothetical protein
MKILFGILLMVGGLCGVAVSAMSTIVANSSLEVFNGLDLSLALAGFCALAFLGGLYNLFLTS